MKAENNLLKKADLPPPLPPPPVTDEYSTEPIQATGTFVKVIKINRKHRDLHTCTCMYPSFTYS